MICAVRKPVLTLTLLCSVVGLVYAESDPVDRALDAELKRASTQLDEPGYPPPYFVSLTAIDVDSYERKCTMGAASVSSGYRQRLILPDVRVGDYTFDNHPVAPVSRFAAMSAGFEADEFSLRHSLWLSLDSAYKSATADFLRKQALRVQRGKTEYDFDDLSREAPRTAASAPAPAWPAGVLDGLCEAGSRALREAPGLLEAQAVVQRRSTRSRLRTSEGFRVDSGREIAEVELNAVDISTDGLRLFATKRFTAGSAAGLPSQDEVQAAARGLISDLERLKLAKTTSPFSAPALIDPSVSAAVVLALALRLSGEEQRDPNGAQIFKGKIGKPVLPKGFELYDDPAAAEFGGVSLVGRYDSDDEGVAPRRAELIEDGVLKGFLLSRHPVIGFPVSNGHGRAYAGYRPVGAPGSLFLSSKKPMPQKKLLELLRQECRRRGKPYGLWVKKLRLFNQQQGTSGHGSIRLMPGLLYLVEAKSGAVTLVRDLDLVGTPLDLMNNIVAAGDDLQAQNIAWNVPVSAVVPSLLLSDAELQRAETKPEKPPILPPPGAEPAKRAFSPSAPPPTIPLVPYVQVERFLVKGYKGPLTQLVMRGLDGLRGHGQDDDYVVEAKLAGRSIPDVQGTLRELMLALKSLSPSGQLERTTLSAVMTRAGYRALHGDGWPEDSPRR